MARLMIELETTTEGHATAKKAAEAGATVWQHDDESARWVGSLIRTFAQNARQREGFDTGEAYTLLDRAYHVLTGHSLEDAP